MFLLNFLATLATVPMLRLIEDVLCRMHFSLPLAPGGAIHAPQRPPEVLCKSSVEVQAALAWTTGASVAVLSAVGLVSALPWGAASDRWGRRPVFWVSYVGILLGMLWSATVLRWPSVFSVRAVVLAPLGNLLGGGPQSMIACVFSAIADVTKADERYVI